MRPLYGWTGYLIRWVPIVTVVGALLFAVQMAWHVRTVRRRTDFRFVDDQDEPRLCRIVEPLTIAAGLPTPYVGVIDSPALNAFACGIRQKDAVLVFTRGLIDGLDDDELAAVAAHEIIHIVNGDIRLIAATNVCLDTLQPAADAAQQAADVKRIHAACSLPILAFVMPVMVVLFLGVMFLRRVAIDGSHLVRLLIASAREFIADAEAVRLTQNPAALVSALASHRGAQRHPGPRRRPGRHDDRRRARGRVRDAPDDRGAGRGDHLRHRLDGPDRTGPPRHPATRAERPRRLWPPRGAGPRSSALRARGRCQCRARARLLG